MIGLVAMLPLAPAALGGRGLLALVVVAVLVLRWIVIEVFSNTKKRR